MIATCDCLSAAFVYEFEFDTLYTIIVVMNNQWNELFQLIAIVCEFVTHIDNGETVCEFVCYT
jgi:hypothetical protein